MDGWKDGWLVGPMDGWMQGQVDGWLGGWVGDRERASLASKSEPQTVAPTGSLLDATTDSLWVSKSDHKLGTKSANQS